MILWFFYVKIKFCLYITHKITISQFSRVCSYYDVKVSSYINGWYLFWYQWKKDFQSYTLVVNLGLNDLQVEIPEGLQHPPSENMFEKKNTPEYMEN